MSEQDVIKFYGDVSALIRDRVKVASIRKNSPKYDFLKQGMSVTGEVYGDEGEPVKIALRVIDTFVTTLRQTPVPLLLLDGYLSVEEGEADLQRYYDGLKESDEIRYVAFTVDEEVEDGEIEYLIPDELFETPIQESIKDAKLQAIFFHSMAQWIADRGRGLKSWVEFLKIHRLINAEQTAVFEGLLKTMAEGDEEKLLVDDPKELQWYLHLNRQTSILYAQAILGLPDSII